MKTPFKLQDIRVKLPFTINKGLSAFTMDWIVTKPHYELDFDVYLPSIQKNLQRGLVWTLLQKQELIMSILKGIRLPTMALVHVNHKVFQVIDGKQRLSAWIDYINNHFPIEYNGEEYFFDDLSLECRNELVFTHIIADVAYEYTGEHEMIIPDEWKIKWFEMINFAGTPADKEYLEYLKS